MLADLLQNVTPEQLLHALRTNQTVVQMALHKIDAYKSFGDALTPEQQLYISSNLGKINEFFNTEAGKDSISILAEEFVKFCKK